MNYRISSDKAAAVSPTVHWLPIDENTPRGVKLQLINRSAGVATYSTFSGCTHWTHWSPLPTFSKDAP